MQDELRELMVRSMNDAQSIQRELSEEGVPVPEEDIPRMGYMLYKDRVMRMRLGVSEARTGFDYDGDGEAGFM